MEGLRSRENAEFLRFFAIVQEFAKRKGCTFFLFSGEGRELKTEGIEGMDLSGWLIPDKEKKEFRQDWEKDMFLKKTDKWDKFETIATWAMQGDEITIEFE